MMKKLKKEIADALGVLLGDEKQAKVFIDELENEKNNTPEIIPIKVISLKFEHSDFDTVSDYVPNKWNNYPEVEPPANELLLAETNDQLLLKVYYRPQSTIDSEPWFIHENGLWLPRYLNESIVKYRKWGF